MATLGHGSRNAWRAHHPPGSTGPGGKGAIGVGHGTTIVRGLTLVEALGTHRNEVWRARAAGAEGDGLAADVAVKLSGPAYEPLLPRRLDRRARALTRVIERGTNLVPP